MKKILFLLSTIFAVQTAIAQADENFLLEQYFNYTNGDSIDTQTDWAVSTKTNEHDGKSAIVKDGTLSYTNYAGSDVGKTIYLNSKNQKIESNAHTTYYTFVDPSNDRLPINECLYTAFLVDFSEMNVTTTREVFIYNNNGDANRGRVWVKTTKDSDNIQFSITKSGTSNIDGIIWSNNVNKNNPVLLVSKYINKSTNSNGANDEFYLYVNPDPTKSEEDNSSCKIDAPDNNAGNGANLPRIGFRQQSNYTATYAGMRISRIWGKAVAVGINIGETGWATFCATQNFTLSGNLKAYVVNKSNASTVSLQEVSVIPANQGVLLKGDKNAKYTLIPTDVGADVTTNLLQANLTATTLPATTGGNTNYILVPDDAGGVMFAPSSGSGTLAANRAYLQLPTPADPAREYVLSFNDDELTGIKAVESSKEKSADVYYDLSGRRVAQPTKGLYIMNGKKYIVK